MHKTNFAILIGTLAISLTCANCTKSEKKKTPPSAPALPERTYVPQAADISPEGFNWIHRDFALIFSGAIYEHNFKGIVRPERMIERKAKLQEYIETLRKIEKKSFTKWNEDHRISFLINTYTAHLLLLSIEKNFENLNDDLFELPNKITVFQKSFSFNDFVKTEILSTYKDPRILLALHCFSNGCPEYRNNIYNFKNLNGMLQSTAFRFFSDNDKNEFDAKTNVLKISSYVKKYRKYFGKDDATFKRWAAPFLEHRKDTKEALAKGRLKITL